MANRYRMYIDESGTHHYSQLDDISKRYLSLTGIVLSEENITKYLIPQVKAIQELISTDPDSPVILHREDIVAKKNGFQILNDIDIKTKFDKAIIDLVSIPVYTIITGVIDKKEHLNKYEKSAKHPYNYLLSLLLERYVSLIPDGCSGDVIAECRGKKEDNSLRQAYEDFRNCGTFYYPAIKTQKKLTSRKLTLKPKTANIAGLQLADLLSLPTKLDVLTEYQRLTDLNENFTKQIIGIIQDRYKKKGNSALGSGKKLI